MQRYRHKIMQVGVVGWVLVLFGSAGALRAQDRLKSMPRYDRFEKLAKEIPGAIKSGTLSVTWVDGGKAFEFAKDGKRWRYDLVKNEKSEIKDDKKAAGEPDAANRGRRGRRFPGMVERGRQFGQAVAPNGRLKAFHRDRNLWLGDPDNAIEVAITTDGSAAARTKNGIASWVYGEELYQQTAIWWSPDSKKVAFYRFDESKVKDYFVALDQLKLQSSVDVEPYPKAGAPNPVVDLLVYDLASKKTTTIDVRDGKPFVDESLGYYVYDISWSAEPPKILFNRTNRRQNIMELVSADPETGKCSVVVHEEWPQSWVENLPTKRFLKDGKRFIWSSERTGFKNFYLYDLSGSLLATLTKNDFDASSIENVDEDAGLVYYYAGDGANPMLRQLHRVKLDGSGDVRVTDPAFHHTVDIAPDGKHLIDIIQTHDTPASTRLIDAEGKVLAELATADTTKFDALGLKKAELFTFKAADGETELYGLLHKPSDFDPRKVYPLLVSVYAGPATNGARELFAAPSPLAELGFLVASFDSRSAAGRGKRFLDAIYLRLGEVEIDDQAAGVKALAARSYVDQSRVGIFGISYGGTASGACLLRYPDVFRAACAMSAVTDFRNYDTIYTERYMRTPQENAKGYDFGSLMTHSKNLKGKLMIYFGTADNNVHPANSLQWIAALERAGKSFEVQVGPDRGHTALNRDRMLEFFMDNLILAPRSDSAVQPVAESAGAPNGNAAGPNASPKPSGDKP